MAEHFAQNIVFPRSFCDDPKKWFAFNNFTSTLSYEKVTKAQRQSYNQNIVLKSLNYLTVRYFQSEYTTVFIRPKLK